MKITKILILFTFVWIFLSASDAWAKKKFDITFVNTPVVVTMGDPAGTSLTYRIKNTNSGGDAGLNINKVEFNLSAPYTLSSSTTAPAGWSITLTSTRATFSVTSNTIPPKIAQNSSQDFTLILGAIPSGAQDSTDKLKSVKATYDDGKPPTNASAASISSTSWTRKSLSIDSFTALDSVTGQAASRPGGTLTVRLTVTNRSTSNWTGIISNPQPPVTIITGNPTVSTVSSPNINLNAGLTGTLIWTYTIGGNCTAVNPPSGTVAFSVTNVKDSTNAVTSKNGSSNTVDIGCFTAALSFNACATSGSSIPVTMILTNNYPNNIDNATPTLTSSGNVTKTSGPTPSSTSVPPGGGPVNITWQYTISGTPGDTYSFTWSATGTLKSTPNKQVSTPQVNSSGMIFNPPPISPTLLNSVASNMNQMVTVDFNFTNTLCGGNAIKKLVITLPAGWTYLDSSALVGSADDWMSLLSGSTVTFTPPGITYMAFNATGHFIITFTLIPSAQGDYNFPVTLTRDDDSTLLPDCSALPPLLCPTVTVGASGAGLSSPKLFKENY